MIEAAIEAMLPGEKPTDPGWYVVRTKYGNHIAEIGRENGRMVYRHAPIDPRIAMEPVEVFVARIYPDRIGQE